MRPHLPDGTVTMVFTDIVGSTALVFDLGDRYEWLLAEHRRAVREIVARHDGMEVDTQGDAFFLVFRRASDAVAAARDVVGASGEDEPVRVRIGVHTGAPARVEEGYVGIDVHVAARIAAAGSGGQILLSRQTRGLVPDEPVRDLGAHRLKDVGEVQLYQCGHADFPPVRSLGRSNLQPPREPLVGRVAELDDLQSLVEGGARLVTLTGAGGIGKTTLARRLAAGLADRFVDGVWFADLSAVAAADLVEPEVATLVGAHAGVADHVQAGDVLLVLDNFEQVLDAAPIVGGWLERCPGLVLVVTSRESLRLSGEHEYPLTPLDDTTAVELFVARARAVVPRFEENADELLQLCRRLEGIPLALELAAARVKLLTPGQLITRLDQRFSVLTGGARDLPARQRTLEATIAWSYDLLDAGEQELFAHLAVFAGGWTLEAAEEVAGADLDRLQSLVAKSLVRFDDGRFRMLETIREYAIARLAEMLTAPALHRSHAAHYGALAALAAPKLTGRDQDAWVRSLAAEDDNLRAALDWCAADAGSRDAGLRLAADLSVFWYLRSRHAEGAARLEPMLAATEAVDSATRASALWGAGLFLGVLADARAATYLDDALAMARRIGDPSLAARSLDMLGLLAFFRNDPVETRSLLEASIAEARAADDLWCLADALGTIGSIYPLMGEPELARRAAGEGLVLARGRGDLQGTRMSLFGLALTAWRAGELDAARATGYEGLEISRRLGDTFFTSYHLWILAAVELADGATDLARDAADEALILAREVGAPLLIVCALEGRAAVARADGDDARARELLSEAEEAGAAGAVPGSYLAEVLRALGVLDGERGDLAAAERRLLQSVELARSVLDPWAERRAASDLERLGQRT
ncbi:MAG: ATP-binding protein [Gaiellales bacterium]